MDFFEAHTHPYWYLIGWLFFPRIMFWFVSAITGGFWFWVGVFICPYIMAAYWATYFYWETNPWLCVLAWLYCFGGSSAEGRGITKRSQTR